MTKKSIVDELTQIHTELNNSSTRNAFETLNTTPVISSEVAASPTVVPESSPVQVKPTTDRIPYELLALTRNEITILEFLIEQGDMVITVKRMAGLIGGRFGTIKYAVENLITKGYVHKKRVHMGNLQGTSFTIEPAFQVLFQKYVDRIKPLSR